MKRIIYLVGQISSDPKTYEWRRNIENYVSGLTNYKNKIELLNPCGNKANEKLIQEHAYEEEGYNSVTDDIVATDMLASLDGGYVSYSNVCICNMNHYTPSRPMIGSYFELSKYMYMHPDVPVIGIFNGDPKEHYHTWHPFVARAVQTWTKDEISAIKLVLNQCFM